MLLIAASVFIAVIIFTATQFQTRWAVLTLDGGALSIWKAEQLREEWKDSIQTVEAAKNALSETQRLLTKAIADRSAGSKEYLEASRPFHQAKGELEVKIRRYDPGLADKLKNAASTDEAIVVAVEAAGALKEKDSAIDEAFNKFKTVQEKADRTYDSNRSLDEQIKSLSARVQEI